MLRSLIPDNLVDVHLKDEGMHRVPNSTITRLFYLPRSILRITNHKYNDSADYTIPSSFGGPRSIGIAIRIDRRKESDYNSESWVCNVGLALTKIRAKNGEE